MKKGFCIHFNGILNGPCKKNHDYHNMKKPGERIPCIRSSQRAGGKTNVYLNVPDCPDFQEPTDEEIRQDEERIQQLIGRSTIAKAAILEHAEGNNTLAGRFPCPVCSAGTLSYGIAPNNKHVHAKCSTADCVHFME